MDGAAHVVLPSEVERADTGAIGVSTSEGEFVMMRSRHVAFVWMDLRYTDEQDAFRAEVRAWLRAHVPKERLPTVGTREGFEAHRAWEQRARPAPGTERMHWPVEYGGRGADVVMTAIFEEEYALVEGPPRITVLGRNLMGPTLMVHGTPEQKDRWLSRILSAEDIWSQGFSEPDAGSDLAGLKTRAVRDGDDFIVNGQKIWTSYGTFSDWIFALVRTDPEAPRHAGITFLAIDMRSPGVEARPLVQVDGRAGFAEVFFTDVRVPASARDRRGQPRVGRRDDDARVRARRTVRARRALRARRGRAGVDRAGARPATPTPASGTRSDRSTRRRSPTGTTRGGR